MQNFKDIKLFATDLDGTLVKEGVFELSDGDFELIRRLKENGVLFAVSTGRPYGNTRRMFAPVADDIMFICDNGNNVIWQGRNIFLNAMDQAVSFEMADFVQALPAEYENVMCTAENYVLMPKRDEDVLAILRDWNMSVRIVEDKEKVVDLILKHTIYKNGGFSPEFITEMEQRWGGKVKHINQSCPEWLDFQDGDKGMGLKNAAECLGIDLQNVAAFGDNTNDIEMLDIAGFSFAMSHAPDAVKAHAKYECSDVRDIMREILALN